MIMLLEVDSINTFYGMSHILFDLSLSVEKGEIVCLLGRNGAGKTTTLRSIIGLTPPLSGSIIFEGQEIRSKQAFRIARLGIGFVPEDMLIIPDLTVRENLEIAMRRKGQWTLETVYRLFSVLKERESQEGGTLSGGEQQMLAIGRALMSNPQLLLLDEPSEGLAPTIVKMLADFMRVLKEEGMTTLLAEQNSKFALTFSDRAYMLEKGEICWHGSCEELKGKPEVMKRYLGV
jgi:branched-chain amino acid transport system ATP-binding protein